MANDQAAVSAAVAHRPERGDVLMIGFDGTNHPSAATVLLDGLGAAFMYAGTPASVSGKDFTAAQYRDYRAHGILCAFVFEHAEADWQGGPVAAQANARALIADCHAKGVDSSDPCCVAIDEHVTTAELLKVVAYVTAFRAAMSAAGWTGPVGVYGFPEVMKACHGLVDWYWGAGTRSSQPSWINVWQDNTGSISVGGAADDKDWILIPLPTLEDEMAATAADAKTIWQTDLTDGGLTQDPFHLLANLYEVINGSVLPQLTAIKGAITTEQAAVLAALKAPTVDVTALAATLAPLLNANQANEFLDALRAQFAK